MYIRDIHKMIRRVERGASGVETHCKPFLLVICRGSLCFSVVGLYVYIGLPTGKRIRRLYVNVYIDLYVHVNLYGNGNLL